MPAVLLVLLQWFARFLIAKFILATTVFVVSNVIANQFMDYLQAAINAQLAGLPGSLAAIVSMIGVPDAISILFSAYSTALALKGLSRLSPVGGGSGS